MTGDLIKDLVDKKYLSVRYDLKDRKIMYLKALK
jgi:hypothetical protein